MIRKQTFDALGIIYILVTTFLYFITEKTRIARETNTELIIF